MLSCCTLQPQILVDSVTQTPTSTASCLWMYSIPWPGLICREANPAVQLLLCLHQTSHPFIRAAGAAAQKSRHTWCRSSSYAGPVRVSAFARALLRSSLQVAKERPAATASGASKSLPEDGSNSSTFSIVYLSVALALRVVVCELDLMQCHSGHGQPATAGFRTGPRHQSLGAFHLASTWPQALFDVPPSVQERGATSLDIAKSWPACCYIGAHRRYSA